MGPEGRDDGSRRRGRRELVRRYVSRSITIKVLLFAVLFVATLVVTVVDTVTGRAGTWPWVVAGVVLGTAVGVVASRMNHLGWDRFEQRIVGTFDLIGVVVLLAYVVFSVFRTRIVGYWVPAEYVAATSTGVLSGVMLGQVLGIRRGLRMLGRRLRATPARDETV